MVEVVYLGKGERRPARDKSLLIECRRGRGDDELIQDASGSVTLRTRPEKLDALIADMERKGATRVYVRGAR
jgi:hypothetical protein